MGDRLIFLFGHSKTVPGIGQFQVQFRKGSILFPLHFFDRPHFFFWVRDAVFAMQSMQGFDLRLFKNMQLPQTVFPGCQIITQFRITVFLVVPDAHRSKGVDQILNILFTSALAFDHKHIIAVPQKFNFQSLFQYGPLFIIQVHFFDQLLINSLAGKDPQHQIDAQGLHLFTGPRRIKKRNRTFIFIRRPVELHITGDQSQYQYRGKNQQNTPLVLQQRVDHQFLVHLHFLHLSGFFLHTVIRQMIHKNLFQLNFSHR